MGTPTVRATLLSKKTIQKSNLLIEFLLH